MNVVFIYWLYFTPFAIHTKYNRLHVLASKPRQILWQNIIDLLCNWNMKLRRKHNNKSAIKGHEIYTNGDNFFFIILDVGNRT